MPEIISRKEARERGLKLYCTGKSCKHGHFASRRLNGNCVECEIRGNRSDSQKAARVAQHAANPEKRRSYSRIWYKKNLKRCRGYCRKFRENNPHLVISKRQKYQEKMEKIGHLIEVLRIEMPDLLKEFGL